MGTGAMLDMKPEILRPGNFKTEQIVVFGAFAHQDFPVIYIKPMIRSVFRRFRSGGLPDKAFRNLLPDLPHSLKVVASFNNIQLPGNFLNCLFGAFNGMLQFGPGGIDLAAFFIIFIGVFGGGEFRIQGNPDQVGGIVEAGQFNFRGAVMNPVNPSAVY